MSHSEIIIWGDAYPEPARQACHYKALMLHLARIGVVGKKGALQELAVQHDDWCCMLRNPLADCTCNVEIVNDDGKVYRYASVHCAS